MHVVVGLGNPGDQFKQTRHNVGSAVVHALAKFHTAGRFFQSLDALMAQVRDGEREVLLVTPMLPVRESGGCVARIVDVFGLEPHHLLIVTDDFNLPPGNMRFRAKGRNGGHTGLSDVEKHLKTTAYPRLRIGVGRPEKGQAAAHLLQPFSAAEQAVMEPALLRANDAITMWWREGLSKCMNQFNAGNSDLLS